MSAKYRISKSPSAQYTVEKNGGASQIVSASDLRQLCQTMGEPYAQLMAELEKNDAVELTVAYGKVQHLSADSNRFDREG
jgi:hypothetical protein